MNNHKNTYIYESTDNGETIYKRKFMDYEHKTVLEDKQTIPKVTFPIRDNNTKTQKQPQHQDINLFDKFLSYLE